MKGGFNVFTRCDTIQLYNYIMLLTKKNNTFSNIQGSFISTSAQKKV